MTLGPGLHAEVELTVMYPDTAAAVGSGDVPVLATPRLVALAEAATVAAVSAELDAGQTSVGTLVRLEHLRPTAVGGTVRVRAELVDVDGRELRFAVTATAAGTVTDASTATDAAAGTVTDASTATDAAAGTVTDAAIGQVVAQGEVVRAVVDRRRFLERLG
jgi:predicted thioesterase